jgi:ADP-heptose:LPS heptosyltransferase
MKFIAQINKLLTRYKKPSDKNYFKNILVVSNTGLGDTILSTPAIISLRQSFPDINITFMIHRNFFPLFKGYEFVDSFLIYSSGFFSQLKLIKGLRKKKIDTIFLFHSNGPEDIFFSICSGAKNILKMTDNQKHEYKHIFLNSPNLKIKHNIEKKIDLLRIFSASVISKEMQLPDRFYLKKNLLKMDQTITCIGIQLGAQDLYKIWPVQRFISLAKKIIEEFKNIKFILFGATKYEKNLVKKFQLGLKMPVQIENLCGETSIEDLPKELNNLDLLITNDTGTLHLAVALRVKTVSLFGPTNSNVFGPYQDLDRHRVIQKDGFFVNKLPKKLRSQEGMELIDVDNVFDVVKKSLK